MNIIKTKIEGVYVLEPKVFEDERGYFFESYNKQTMKDLGLEINFVQDNESFSTYGVIRGLHYQIPPYEQIKLIRVTAGKIKDVAVDLRVESITYGQSVSCIISDENKRQFLIPAGFAHGFSVLSKQATVNYKCSNVYHKESERSINLLSPNLAIDWEIKEKESVISEKDQLAPYFT